LSILVGAILLFVFVKVEDRRASRGQPVVFDFRDLVHPGFRYGLINTTVLAMGEFGAFFVLPLFMQVGLHLSAIESGRWLLPAGIAAFIGGGVGGALSRRFGPKYVITTGLTLEAMGIWIYVIAFGPHTTFLSFLPGLILHGIGIGFATSQLTNVVLSDIPPQKAGSASGAAGMVRQVGTALGIALIGAIFVSQSAAHIRSNLEAQKSVPASVREQVVASVHAGVGSETKHLPTGDLAVTISDAISSGIADASKLAVGFAGIVVLIGAGLSTLVPNIPPDADPSAQTWESPEPATA
jgi:MFS family permease